MWISSVVLLLASWASLADFTNAEETMKHSASATRLASLRSRRMVAATLAPNVPWQAMVYLSDSVMTGGYAGGALISDRWVLTAGRNLFVRKTRQDTRGQSPLIPKVYLGITGRPEAVESKEVAVQKVVLHPGFQNHTDWDNDLALIQLKEPVVMSDKVTPIPLPERGQRIPNGGVIAGWGWGTDFTLATSLKHLVLPLAANSFCHDAYAGNLLSPTVDDNMICTSGLQFGSNVCFGDAGGALVVEDPNTQEIFAAGILSYDKPCRRDTYAVYMKISAYLPWIHSVIRGDTETSAAVRSQAVTKMISLQRGF
ncbi:haptoglobin [Xyrichtys novacula]|uniref:Haptoglobin n=1 Tax=Xyrichtys novacula TaxID=13765 RepID=A0AAV1EM08_XYRNO|nr:haptoglobin [Xyrichtys novacula]